MVRVQAAEDGTLGQGREFRLVRKDTIFDMPDDIELPDWVVKVPADTKADEPFMVKRDHRAQKWVVQGKKAKPKEEPSSFSEIHKGADRTAREAEKRKTAVPSLT
jgi:hypothetical protein